jgi:hypothetical protein
MAIERHFTENSDGTIEFTPIAKDEARLIFRQLKESLSFYREKIKKEQNLLDITPKENEDLLKRYLKILIMSKVELLVIVNQFKSVKRWFDKNNLPYPDSSEDQKPKGKGGRPRDPKIAVLKRQLRLDYYNLTEKQEFKKSKAIRILEEKYPWKKSTIETYIK